LLEIVGNAGKGIMPIYAYRCESCGFEKDVLQKMSDAPLTQCPECSNDTFRKQVTAAGFQLKGSGWYVTDFRGGANANGAKSGAANETNAAGANAEGANAAGGESAKADGGKTETASASSAASTSTTPAATPAAGGSTGA
jgi:putative FmdB family regulatory protein